MAFSISSTPKFPYSIAKNTTKLQINSKLISNITTKCELQEGSSAADTGGGVGPKSTRLGIGSPIIVIEAPKLLKTAASVPCLVANDRLVKPGDVGRIVSRKPKDVWAVRLTVGTYLIDGKYFKPLELDQ